MLTPALSRNGIQRLSAVLNPNYKRPELASELERVARQEQGIMSTPTSSNASSNGSERMWIWADGMPLPVQDFRLKWTTNNAHGQAKGELLISRP